MKLALYTQRRMLNLTKSHKYKKLRKKNKKHFTYILTKFRTFRLRSRIPFTSHPEDELKS